MKTPAAADSSVQFNLLSALVVLFLQILQALDRILRRGVFQCGEHPGLFLLGKAQDGAVIAHAALPGTGGGQLAATGAGQGGMEDYRTILRFAKQEKPYIFATLENTTPENAVECLNYLKKQYDEC